MRRLQWRALTLLFLSGVLAALAGADTALDRYVRKPDPAYKYELVNTIPGKGYTASVLDMASQTWRKPGEVDRVNKV